MAVQLGPPLPSLPHQSSILPGRPPQFGWKPKRLAEDKELKMKVSFPDGGRRHWQLVRLLKRVPVIGERLFQIARFGLKPPDPPDSSTNFIA
jgi:hypothetical protein